MYFASDNTAGTHPAILQALVEANAGYQPSYGDDALMERVTARIREIFEAPQAAVYLVATGTAANALILGTLTQPFGTVFCTPMSHINEDECNAPEFYTGGAKLTLVDPVAARMTPETLTRAIESQGNRGVHGPQRGPVSITQVTEKGTVYSVDEIAALGEVARGYGLPLHLDGARFANALVALGCSPARMTWKAGVDAVSFGGTKNGCMGVEAVIFFDPARAWEFELRRKRGAHLFSKHRYLSAQMLAYLEGDLWLEMARHANEMGARLLRGLRQIPDVAVHFDPTANLIFATLPRAVLRRLQAGGARFSLWAGELEGPDDEPLVARFVTSWATTGADVETFLALAAGRGD